MDRKPVRQAIIQGVILTSRKFNIDILIEGGEREEGDRWLANKGVDLFQGYYFAYPGFEQLPEVPDELF